MKENLIEDLNLAIPRATDVTLVANYWRSCSHGACQIEQSRSRHSSDLSPGVSVAGTDGQEMLEWRWSRPSRLSVSPSAPSLAPVQLSRTSC